MEPTYEKKMETLDELVESDVVYGYYPALNFALATLNFPELITFLEKKKLQEDCSDLRKCIERMVTKRDVAFINDPLLANYFAMEMGTADVSKIICSIDDSVGSGGLTIIFRKGNPLLDRINILMRRYLESGFLERITTELQHRATLRGAGRFTEAAGDMFFVFSLSHLMPAFVVVLVGTVLSSAVFIGELIVNCLCRRKGKSCA